MKTRVINGDDTDGGESELLIVSMSLALAYAGCTRMWVLKEFLVIVYL